MKNGIHKAGWVFVAAFVLGVTSLEGISADLPKSAAMKPRPQKFYGVLDLKQSGVGAVLIGGRPARSADFPASFYSVSDSGSCTSALVSARVLLTAAHCVANGETISVTLNKQSYDGVCTHAPGYVPVNSLDWALCLLSGEIKGIAYENVNTDESHLRVGGQLLLAGFGCVTHDAQGGHDSVYRIGEAEIIQVPTGGSNDILTQGPVIICFGDSGGPSFLYVDAKKRNRVVVAVNSRTDIPNNTSYLASTSTKPAKDFLANWSKDNRVSICGVHKNAIGCRQPQ